MNYSDYVFGKSLKEIDPIISNVIEYEEERQARKIILIPSESICPAPVLMALGTSFNNIYAEGYLPGFMVNQDEKLISNFNYQLNRLRRYSDRRFYKGCDYVNVVEALAQRRAAALFATEKNPQENIYVNVQPLSGSIANSAVYDAFVEHGDVVMGMSLMHGGHLSHGSEFNRSGKNYRIVSYEVNPGTNKLDYDEIMELTIEHKPKMIIAGYTSYPWAPDWKQFRKIADSVGAILFADISHPAGLVVAGVYPNPIDYADVVTCTTHKTLFGPRGAIIMTTNHEYAENIDQAVFPGEQGGPHVNKFAAMSVAFKIAQSDEYKKTQKQIVENTKYLGEVLEKNGLRLAYGGTDTHLLMIDLNSIKTKTGFPVKGEIAVRILDLCGIVANKNTIPGDIATAEASGIRLGTPWITQRGITKKQIEELGNIIAEILKNINPFTYKGLTGDLPRGKIDIDLLEKSKRRVDILAKSLANEKSIKDIDYPHYLISSNVIESDFMGKGVLKINGDRAVLFLEEVTTNKVCSLKAGEICKSFLLDKESKLIAPIIIYKLYPDEMDNDQFLVISKPEDKESIKIWLRGLSDGYITFDNSDIFKKIEGPVVILDINETSEEYKDIIDIIKNIKTSDLELGSFEKGIDSKSLYKEYSGLFDLSKPYFIGQNTIEVDKYGVAKEVFNYSDKDNEPKPSCLYSEHLKLTKNIVAFAGWKMPIRYEGIIEEHRAVREACGLFDISHMGILEVSGRYSTQFLDTVSTNYVPWIDKGESQYGYLLDIDGNVIDDIMIYKRDKDRYMVVVNAANNDKDLAWLTAVNSKKVIIDSLDTKKEILGEANIIDLKNPLSGNDCRVDIALQGPYSINVIKDLAENKKIRYALERIKKTRFIETELGGISVIVSRTGYTGEEIGFELFMHPSNAKDIWNRILDAGKKYGLKPVGLGARDSLRVEAGLPLYGHELAGQYNISPIEAGFASYVKLHKPYFIGRKAIIEKLSRLKMTIVRFRMSNKGVKMAKTGDFVISKRSQKIIGWVTSCAVNQDGVQVGMAYVDKRYSREGIKIGIISAPHDDKMSTKSLKELNPGDKFYLHEEAKIISRFTEK